MLKNFDHIHFLKNYWQKKPLLIKGGIEKFKSPLNMDELASLALEEQAHSRLIISKEEVGHKDDYIVEEGPFSEERLSSLGDENWNLLIQEADHWSDDILFLREYFSFIPQWRFDDVMASLGVKGGHVGAHLDWYDVFILQAEGTKTWKLEDAPRTFEQFEGDHLIKDLDVKLLSDFNPSLEFTLHPGDILYIPIGHAHQGVNDDKSLSFSFGLRSPTLRDMIVEHLKDELDGIHEDERLRDEPSTWQNNGQIPDDLMTSLLKSWPSSLTLPKNPQLWFGKLVTTPSRHTIHAPEEKTDNELFTAIDNGEVFRNPHGRLAYYLGEKSVYLFANGERLSLEKNPTNLKCVELLCDQLNFEIEDLMLFSKTKGFELLLRFLYEQQILIQDDE